MIKYVPVLILLLVFSCTRDHGPMPNKKGVKVTTVRQPDSEPVIYDTVFPESYFPAYPGSYWTYQLNGTTTYTDTTSLTYQLDSFITSSSAYAGFSYSTPTYVPYYNDEPIYGYKKLYYRFAPFCACYQKYIFLSEKLGDSYWDGIFHDPRWPISSNEISYLAEKKVNAKNDSILVVIGHWENTTGYPYGAPPADSSKISHREYKKNVGLTLHYVVDTLTLDTTKMIKLIGCLSNGNQTIITDHQLPITDYRLPITVYRSPNTAYRTPNQFQKNPINDQSPGSTQSPCSRIRSISASTAFSVAMLLVTTSFPL